SCGRRRSKRRCWCCSRRRCGAGKAVNFRRAQRRTVAIISACEPDVASAEEAVTATVAVRCEITPRSDELTACAPTIGERKVDVYLIRRVRRRSSPAHYVHLLRELRD